MRDMDKEVIDMVKEYLKNAFGEEPKNVNFYIVWKCKTLQNWKYLIGNDVNHDYYECTYNGDRREWYLDVCQKENNLVYVIDGHFFE